MRISTDRDYINVINIQKAISEAHQLNSTQTRMFPFGGLKSGLLPKGYILPAAVQFILYNKFAGK